ncbi:expressed unknown protein [Seminavis robusta]|uniref:Uncharacterized protein n=1 Tax=Seminavis robusta TaxID=568900 RepID=A0A9N8E7K3_9STRA|nr:expressed unknown protein [Seminavis robusta]|eukprot:Sro768_g199640.1 n/a (399) ;mRNA; f:26251-27447
MSNSALLYRLSVQHAHPLGPWQAILGAVTRHHTKWELSSVTNNNNNEAKVGAVFRVLDLASGPRGEPGTTIAHALPLALVHCTDSCALAVADIPVVALPVTTLVAVLPPAVDDDDDDDEQPDDLSILITPPPKNLTKSVQDLTNLSSYKSNTINAIVCCYGYGLSKRIYTSALQEAHRVLAPGGILAIATWQESAIAYRSGPEMSSGRGGVFRGLLGGGGDFSFFSQRVFLSGWRPSFCTSSEEEWFLPPIVEPLQDIELSAEGELEALLQTAGFVDDSQSSGQEEGGPVVDAAVITTRGMGYPYDLGDTPLDQFDMGTILIREELEELGSLRQEGSVNAGGWSSLAEEGFWRNIRKYIDTPETTTTSANSGNRNPMLLKDNIFKLTVATKSYVVSAS